MIEIEELLKKYNCENCGEGLCSDLEKTGHVCYGWQPKSCEHDYYHTDVMSEDQDILLFKCRKCCKEIVYIRSRKCKDCAYFGCNTVYPCHHPRGIRAVSEDDYCSWWVKK